MEKAPQKYSYWYPLGLTVLFLIFVKDCLFRQFWFDEALTLMNFAWMPDPVRIYCSYVIPNNQIIYTVFLHYWSQLPSFGLRPDFFLRLLSLGFALGTLLLLYFAFRRSCGKNALWLSLAALAVSPPFLIYATALRGYMAGCFFVTCSLVFARRFVQASSFRTWVPYFAGCVLCVGTIPSNLLALGGVVCFVLPGTLKDFWRLKRSYVLALTPFAALICFYLPILNSFLGVFKLGEGWRSSADVLIAYRAAVAGVFGFLILCVIPAFCLMPKKCRRVFPLLAFVLPVIAVFLLHKPPFPRVFLPLFPVLALVIAQGIKHLSALLKNRKKRRALQFILAGLVLLWGVCTGTEAFKRSFAENYGKGADDDFFYGYYMRKNHLPEEAAKQLRAFYAPGRLPAVYLSFSADPWPVMYYLLSHGYQAEFLFDGPRGPVKTLLPGSLVIINKNEDLSSVSGRFSCRLKTLFETPMHKIAVTE